MDWATQAETGRGEVKAWAVELEGFGLKGFEGIDAVEVRLEEGARVEVEVEKVEG